MRGSGRTQAVRDAAAAEYWKAARGASAIYDGAELRLSLKSVPGKPGLVTVTFENSKDVTGEAFVYQMDGSEDDPEGVGLAYLGDAKEVGEAERCAKVLEAVQAAYQGGGMDACVTTALTKKGFPATTLKRAADQSRGRIVVVPHTPPGGKRPQNCYVPAEALVDTVSPPQSHQSVDGGVGELPASPSGSGHQTASGGFGELLSGGAGGQVTTSPGV